MTASGPAGILPAMPGYRRRASDLGVVAFDAQESTGRRPFVQVDPAILESLDARTLQDASPSSEYADFDPLQYLRYLPESDREAFWMVDHLGKRQSDVGQLLGLKQPTISEKLRRCREKMAYLAVLTSVDVLALVDRMDFLRVEERDVLRDLMYYAHQEAVGLLHGKRQSSVKWIAVKAREKLEELEREDPRRWSSALALVYLLFRNLRIRVRSAADG